MAGAAALALLLVTTAASHENGPEESLKLLLLDRSGEPLADRELEVFVRDLGPNEGHGVHRVVSGPTGLITIAPVSYPLEFFVATQRSGERVLPDFPRRMTLPSAAVIPIRWEPRHEVVLEVAGAELAEDLRGADLVDAARLEVLPLTRLGEPVRVDFASHVRTLSERALASLGTDGTIHLGDLPGGRYLLTLVVPGRGTWNREVRVDERRPRTSVRVELPVPECDLAACIDAPGALVVDGYVTASLAGHLGFTSRGAILHAGDRVASLAVTDAEGRFELAAHNPANRFLTVMTAEEEVYHLEKASLCDGRLELRHHPGDVSLSGVVRDVAGRPLADLVVNLTSLFGGEDAGMTLTPNTLELRDLRTDDQGRFRLEGLHPGAYLLSVSSPEIRPDEGLRRFYYLPDSLAVVDLSSSRSIEVELDRAGVGCDRAPEHLHVAADHTHR